MELDELINGIRGRKVHSKEPDAEESSPRKAAAQNSKLTVQATAEPLGVEKTAAKTAASHAFEQLTQHVHTLLVQKLDPAHLKKIPEDRQRLEVRRVVEQIIDSENQPLSLQQKKALTEDVLDDALGFGPLEKLLRDQTISDILINGANSVYVERNGQLREEAIHFRDDAQLLEIIQRIVSRRWAPDRYVIADGRCSFTGWLAIQCHHSAARTQWADGEHSTFWQAAATDR